MMYSLALLSTVLAALPTGDYYGKKDVFFHKIQVHMDTLPSDPGYFSLSVTGAPSGNVNCAKEQYNVAGTAVTMPNYGKAGDCATEQFKAAKLTFESAVWDEAKDEVTLHAKWSFVKVTIVCKKQSAQLAAATGVEIDYDVLASPEFAGVEIDYDALEAALKQPALEKIVLGRPPEHRHPGFEQFSTCTGSGAREHTMAQMTVDFTNDCATVSAEIIARAQGDQGWQDPHNKGKYAVLATEGNLISVRRKTGNDEYTDHQTFSLSQTATGGCAMNACSESQGNSNNDQGTNLCDMMNLFCNSATKNTQDGVACEPVKTDLAYTVPYLECGRYRGDNGEYRQHQCQNFADTCLRQSSGVTAPALEEAKPICEANVVTHKRCTCNYFMWNSTPGVHGGGQEVPETSICKPGKMCAPVFLGGCVPKCWPNCYQPTPEPTERTHTE